MKPIINQSDLNQFSGSENWYRHSKRLIYTDGISFVAEKAGAYWLIDLIASYQPVAEEFQVWILKKSGHGYVVECSDGNDNIVIKQDLEYTDFPEENMPFKMYYCNETLMLPSEY